MFQLNLQKMLISSKACLSRELKRQKKKEVKKSQMYYGNALAHYFQPHLHGGWGIPNFFSSELACGLM
jgi:hypothetical protein